MKELVWTSAALLLGAAMIAGAGGPPRASAAPGRPLVMLDPGHGGIDPGAVSPDGVAEKAINLAVARLTAADLAERGITAALTRDRDNPALTTGRFIVISDLRYRAWLSRHLGATLFLSIHANSEPTRTVAGPILYYNPARATSLALARTLVRALAQRIGAPVGLRPIHQLVLSEQTIPAATVEVGFLTHPGDLRRLREVWYQRALAEGISAGVSVFLSRPRSSR